MDTIDKCTRIFWLFTQTDGMDINTDTNTKMMPGDPQQLLGDTDTKYPDKIDTKMF